ncbi:glutathione S-transferase family protein [Halocynthiibacter sp. C4]|uniref:glutathione S-transferase family protein n=1 Tax=Halocynthiibacter sp. C4 TaxID=2992758 RepID=UPI00237A6E0C|nr:glutathione S-transferase family protein [Halocynthiibacter sp. C4]MDE0589248.1 glutathione S-transferase family protein [Halocynthiibacter sp. C4]
MTDITLHHAPQTRSMRSLWLLHEIDRAIGLPFLVVEHPFGKNLRSPEYLALNPAGRVPALEIGGQTLFETGAITEYLCEQYPEAGLGCAAGDSERADWLIWVHFSETISQHAAALTQQHIALYEDEMRSLIIMKLEAARLKKCYAALEARLEGRDYVLDRGFSAADISLGQALYMSKHFASTDEFPNITAWYTRLSERAAFKASLPEAGGQLLYQKDFYEVPDVGA